MKSYLLFVVIFLSFVGLTGFCETNYYFSSKTGDNSNNGTSINAPWESFEKLKNLKLNPGDSLLFSCGSEFSGGVVINDSGTENNPIVFTNYGAGDLPSFSNTEYKVLNGNVFQVKGSNIIIDGLLFKDCSNSPSKINTEILLVGAVYSKPGADNLIVRNSEFIDCPIGIYLNSQHCLITQNYLHDCNRFLSEPDWGPIGIVIGNAFNEISYNTCENYVKVGGNYGADGGFLEIDDRFFGNKAHDIEIHHNRSYRNMGFLEVETRVTGNNLDVYYNLSDDYQEFIFYWGGNNSRIENNTVIRTRPSLNGAVNTVFTMKNGNFTLKNNIFIVANGIQVLVTAPYNIGNYGNVVHENNLYFCTDRSVENPCGKELGKGEIIGEPQFVGIAEGNFHLQIGSPAIDAGLNLGYKMDLDGTSVPQNKITDIGAFEKIP